MGLRVRSLQEASWDGLDADQRSVMVRTIQPERTPSTMQRADITPVAIVV
jgi:hypothetical protein